MPTAKIDITVTTFRDINTTKDTPRWTAIADPVITDSANGKVTIDPKTPLQLTVKGPASINLEFTILPAGVFVPAGVAFIQKAGTGDPQGKKNFDLGQLTATTITINDKFSPAQPHGSKTRWKFFLLVQQVATGALGIIDPDIENEN
jgi:hypothetical protein